jgi:hypothetical protein
VSGIAPSADYTDRDFDSLRLRLESLIRSAFPTWTDFNVSSFGNVLVDLFAFVLDVLGLYQENQAGEAFFPTATQRQNLIALAKIIGYQPPGATPAQASVTLALVAPPIGSVTIPAGSTCRTAEITSPVVFQLLAPVVFTAGMNPPQLVVEVENSASFEDIFPSTSLPNQALVLAETPFIDSPMGVGLGPAVVTAANGTFLPAPNNNFLASGPTDRHYTWVVDNDDRATITFGNGINGAIPLGTITVDYKTGGGSAGNVEQQAISKFDGAWTDNLGNPASVSVTNPVAANGGSERATVAQIKLLAPQSLRVQNRTVSREDYEINARKVPGVARALMTTSNEDPGVLENNGILYVVPVGGGAPSQGLKDAVLTMVTVTYPNTLTFQLLVQNPVYITLDLVMVIFRAARTTPAQVGAAIRAALATFFAISQSDGTPNPTVDFGFNYSNAGGHADGFIPLGPVFSIVEDLSVVRRVSAHASEFTINGVHADVTVLPMQFPVLGSVTIIDGDTGSPL